MFTGLVNDIGKIIGIQKNTDGILFNIETKLINQIQVDDSVCVDGVCQTATAIINAKYFTVQAIKTTLDKTTFRNYKFGTLVNLELALRFSDRLGGHLVSGHINNIGKIIKIVRYDKSILIDINYPHILNKYFINEGSVTVNGVSLTIANLTERSFTIGLIPHTLAGTNLGLLSVGSMVNLEVDMISKYVENFISNNTNMNTTSISINRLKEMGY